MSDNRPRNDAAMADILSSIRRIVAEEDRRIPHPTDGRDDVLELTADMRLPSHAPPQVATSEPFQMSQDEAMIADIARAVLRDEMDGEIGRNLLRQVREIAKAEVSRALAEGRGARD